MAQDLAATGLRWVPRWEYRLPKGNSLNSQYLSATVESAIRLLESPRTLASRGNMAATGGTEIANC